MALLLPPPPIVLPPPPFLPSPLLPARGALPAAADADSPSTIGHEWADARFHRRGNLGVLAAPPSGPAPAACDDFCEKHGDDAG
jgi:hypothetical protein